jgi:hypothetical protein
MRKVSTQSAASIVVAWLCVTLAAHAEVRTWTDTTGKFKREASLERLAGESVVLKTPDGKELTIPLSRLSPEDQAYAKKTATAAPIEDPFRIVDAPSGTVQRSTDGTADVLGEFRVVIAKGVGATVEDAKKDAYREAVRQVVGAYVEGDTLIRNDELIEDKVLALSGALVQKADVISESVTTSEGLTRLRIRAEVKVTEVMNSLAKINITTAQIRTSDVQGQVITLAEQTEAAELALGDAKSWQSVPASFFVLKLVGQPKVLKARGDDATVQLLLQLSPDRDQYMAFAKRLVTVLSKLEGPKGSFLVDGRNPDARPALIKEGKEELWRHTLVFSCLRGNGAYPEIAYAFPPNDRDKLKAHFEDMGADLPSKSQCLAYCFNQNAGSGPDGCGLAKAAKEWLVAVGRHKDERMVVCVMTHTNDAFNRTKWEWFTCDRSLFPSGQDSPWLRAIECEITLHDKQGAELASDVIPLTEGFGVSCPNLQYGNPFVMIAPMWVDTGDVGWPDRRYAYVPQFTFPRWIELSADEASSISEVKCAVRPIINQPD